MGFIPYFALAAAFYCLVRYFKAKKEYLSWKKHDLLIGEIGEETRRVPTNGGTKYIYHFTLNTTPEPTKTTYEDFVRANETPTLKVGDKVEVYYDPIVKYHRDKKKLQKAPKPYLIGFIVCFAVAFVCSGLIVLMGMLT
jgi:hypothetical protein